MYIDIFYYYEINEHVYFFQKAWRDDGLLGLVKFSLER